MKAMEDTKVKQLHTNVNQDIKEDSSIDIQRESIKNSPFEVITIDGYSFGSMGDYRLTEKGNDKKKIKKELEKITWNRVIQVFMILNELKDKINLKTKEE